MGIILKTTIESEKTFYEMLSSSTEVRLKDLCRKLPRNTVYRCINNLLQMQELLGKELITKKAGICKKTSMPILLLERKAEIQVEACPGGAFVCFSQGHN